MKYSRISLSGMLQNGTSQSAVKSPEITGGRVRVQYLGRSPVGDVCHAQNSIQFAICFPGART